MALEVAAEVGPYVPAGQLAHARLPGAALNLPGVQSKHVVLLLAPVIVLKVPVAQGVTKKPLQKEPAGHWEGGSGESMRMRLLAVSATYKLPAASTATPHGYCAGINV